MKNKIFCRSSIPGLTLLIFLILFGAQASMMDEIGIHRVSEECGKWRISFNWSEMNEYKSSISHADSESMKQKIATDSLILTSSVDRSKVLKVSIITYSESYAAPLNSSSISTTANETLAKSDVCKGINMANRMIDGKSGVYAKGIKCPLEEPVIVAIYPLDYHLDRPGGVLTANALSIILSTYDQVISDRLINSINIVQTK